MPPDGRADKARRYSDKEVGRLLILIPGLYVAMRQVMKSMGRKRHAKLERLVDRIARRVRSEPP